MGYFCKHCTNTIPERDIESCYEPFAPNDALYIRCPCCGMLGKVVEKKGVKDKDAVGVRKD